MSSERLLIAGCGFLGQALAERWIADGGEVIAVTRGGDLGTPVPYPVEACDLTSLDSVLDLARRVPPPDAIVHCASSGRQGAEMYGKIYLGGVIHLQRAFGGVPLLLTSSTSVYPQTGGENVTETSPAEPDRETGAILRQAEDATLKTGGIVARLGGLYGPGRSVILQRFLDGTAIIETGISRYLNQIHRDDAAAALALLLRKRQEAAGEIYNVCDGHALTQRECYEQLAAHFQKPLPPEGSPNLDRKRGWTHKRIESAKLRALGWEPRYPTFMDAIRHDPDLAPH